MKKAMMAVPIMLVVLMGCAGMEPTQEDAALRIAGRFLAVAVMQADPEVIEKAEAYCIYFDENQSIDLVALAIGYLLENYGENALVVDAAMDVLILLGFDEFPTLVMLEQVDESKLMHQVSMALRGFCSAVRAF